MQPDVGLVWAGVFCFFTGYMSRVVLRFFVRLVSGSPEDL